MAEAKEWVDFLVASGLSLHNAVSAARLHKFRWAAKSVYSDPGINVGFPSNGTHAPACNR